jgi:hypothetical protein
MDQVKPKITPKDFFLHLALIATLYITTVSFLSFIFDVINHVFPDRQVSYYDPYSTSMRMAISVIIIVYPLFLYLLRTVAKDFVVNPEKKELALRKWLIYLTLFVTGATLAVDLIVLINTFLGGEITLRFILKALAVLIVAGTIFRYSFADLKDKITDATRKKYELAVSIVVIISLIGGFFLMGTPSSQRALRDDLVRTGDLSTIQYEITSYWQHKQKLPESLNELNDSISGYKVPVDPSTGVAYEYQKVSATSFKLCATFAHKSGENKPEFSRAFDENWSHEKGYTCFDRTIDPQKYPPVSRGAFAPIDMSFE